MKRFLVFEYPQFYPSGGRQDMIGDFDTLTEAIAAIERGDDGYMRQGYDVLDMETREWVDFKKAPEWMEGKK